MSQPQALEASIIIPCKNARPYLRPLLASVLSQKVPFEYEVLFLDSASTDGTLKILHGCRDPRLKVVPIKPREFSHSRTRNEGIRMSRGRFCVLLVQDAVPVGENWLQALLAPFSDASVAGVFCRQIPREDSGFLVKRNLNQWITASMTPHVKSLDGEKTLAAMTPEERARACYFDNVCSAVRREVWEKVPFPDVPFAEDQRWSKQVLLQGYRIAYQPEAAVIHSHDRSVFYTFKRVCIQHCMAYENYGRDPVPTRAIAVHNFKVLTMESWDYLRSVEGNFVKRALEMIGVPFYSLAEVAGKFIAVRYYAKRGKRPRFRGV